MGLALVAGSLPLALLWRAHRRAGAIERRELSILAVSGIVGTLLGGYVGDRLRPRFAGAYFLVSGVGILIACPAIVAMLYLPFPAAWGAVFVAEFFLFFNTGPSNTILANVTHPSVRATAFALNILLIHALGDALSPPVLGHIAERFSWNAAFALVVLNMAAAAVMWMIGSRFLERDTARALRAADATEGPTAPANLPPDAPIP
jgi:sugar phosphate permease